jgi:hypothetical protein
MPAAPASRAMPIMRSNFSRTSFRRKMRAYLAERASRRRERRFGWKAFSAPTVANDEARLHSMTKAARDLGHSGAPGVSPRIERDCQWRRIENNPRRRRIASSRSSGAKAGMTSG